MNFLPALKDEYEIVWSLKAASSKPYAAPDKAPKQKLMHHNPPRKTKFSCMWKLMCNNVWNQIKCWQGWKKCCSDYLTNSIFRTQDKKAKGDRMKVCTMINMERISTNRNWDVDGISKVWKSHFKINIYFLKIKDSKLLEKLALWHKRKKKQMYRN